MIWPRVAAITTTGNENKSLL